MLPTCLGLLTINITTLSQAPQCCIPSFYLAASRMLRWGRIASHIHFLSLIWLTASLAIEITFHFVHSFLPCRDTPVLPVGCFQQRPLSTISFVP
ncbi:hypothetical protein F4777DRAFT_424491 [Nemania sp. FL0916]|nr:hypothetical protein F4777DRAFT_424491 [Nemania sp. FL0916]